MKVKMKMMVLAALALCGAAADGQQRTAPDGFVFVPGGSFQMGNANGWYNEKPVRRITLRSFYMSRYPVTQKEWREIMGGSPSRFRGESLPVENVSWYDAADYCNKRSRKEGLTPAYRGSGDAISCDWNASGYRLPTEAEWEYAAKGGSGSPGNYAYAGGDNVDRVAWYTDNSLGVTHPAGTKAPNSLGLYDMSGNVWEWCWDRWGDYNGAVLSDPRGASSGVFRVIRGGGWANSTASMSPAHRSFSSPSAKDSDLGFRIVRH